MGSSRLEPFEHQVDHGDMHPCFAPLSVVKSLG